jgi:hypothetical protein
MGSLPLDTGPGYARRPDGSPGRPDTLRPVSSIHWAVWLKGVIARAMDTMARGRPPKPADGAPQGAVRVESLTMGDVAAAVDLTTRVLGVAAPGYRHGADAGPAALSHDPPG